ncbi:MAG: ankyrin repeat domain-containing protein [Bdellovibrionales bacterium]|nr:ankyrin repeat domain-containing protein [Bdellovibrionales bacterium]
MFNGANVDEQDENGKTALHHAASVNCTLVVEILIINGANVLIRDKQERLTPGELAIVSKAYESFNIILKAVSRKIQQ